MLSEIYVPFVLMQNVGGEQGWRCECIMVEMKSLLNIRKIQEKNEWSHVYQ